MTLRWLVLTIPIFVGSVAMLAWTIRGLVREGDGAAVASLPVAERSEFTLDVAGEYDLSAEGRLGSRDFAAMEFELADRDGRAIPLHNVWVRSSRTSLSGRTRLQLRSFRIAQPGTLTLGVRGIAEAASTDDRVVIGRAVPGASLRILGIALFGVLTIASLVGSILLAVTHR